MKTLLLAAIAALTIGCQATRPTSQPLVYSGGDGSSCEQAVVIRDATIREVGLLAEKVWLEERFPGHRNVRESSLTSADRHYDVIEFATVSGEPRKVYFDTTDFIHK
jgi:hypothetical protein